MKFKLLFFILILSLFILRGYFFINSLKLSEEVKVLDQKIKALQIENILLEKDLSKLDSYLIISSSASELGFVKKAQTIPLDNLGFAFKGY